MTKGITTPFGEPLSPESRKRVNEVRLRITQPIHRSYNTDFNIYRFILACERLYKKEKDIIESAAKNLNNHLRIRKAYKLDATPDMSFDENPIFEQRFLPKGDVLPWTDSSNRLLWYVEYATINIEGLTKTIRSSESIRYQFLEYEHILRLVNKQEERTTKLSGLRHVIDMNGYEISPFTMFFVTGGSLTYYSQLFHFENYPELVSLIEMVNVAKWVHVPYRILRSMMPDSFCDRFRLYDENFLPDLQKDIDTQHIPTTLGGRNSEIVCQKAIKITAERHWRPTNLDLLKNLEIVHIPPRKTRQMHIDINETGKQLSWYYSTDGDIFFGVFFQPFEDSVSINPMSISHGMSHDKEIDYDKLEMVYPWLKISAKIVHETDYIECLRPGRYWIVFCNKISWVQRRTVNLTVQINDENCARRLLTDGTISESTYIEMHR